VAKATPFFIKKITSPTCEVDEEAIQQRRQHEHMKWTIALPLVYQNF